MIPDADLLSVVIDIISSFDIGVLRVSWVRVVGFVSFLAQCLGAALLFIGGLLNVASFLG